MKATSKHAAESQRAGAPAAVTYVEDTGAVYDAPLEVVWDFMNDETFHSKAHKAVVRNFAEKPISEITTLLSYEKRVNGRWEKMVCRMTTIRPAVRIQEDLDGPFAGSKTVFLYTSQGERTVVNVFGYVRSSEMTPAEIRRERFGEQSSHAVPSNYIVTYRASGRTVIWSAPDIAWSGCYTLGHRWHCC